MKILLTEFISLDGVIQAPGGAGEDTEGGFSHGGWSMPYFDPDSWQRLQSRSLPKTARRSLSHSSQALRPAPAPRFATMCAHGSPVHAHLANLTSAALISEATFWRLSVPFNYPPKRLRVSASASQNPPTAYAVSTPSGRSHCWGHWSMNNGRTSSTALVSGSH